MCTCIKFEKFFTISEKKIGSDGDDRLILETNETRTTKKRLRILQHFSLFMFMNNKILCKIFKY